jgi:hypothetical protein
VSSRRRWWLIAGAVFLVWVVVAGFLLVRAARDLQAGKDAALAARDGLDATTIASGEPLPELREARRRFASASSKTGSVVLAPMRVLPIVGRQVRSVRSLSSAARDVTGAAVRTLERAQQVLDDPASGGPARVRQIRSLRDAVADAQQEVRRVSLGPRDGLLGPLADARNELGEELAEATETLDDAVAGADAGLRLLEGPRDYLLVAANNAEMRAGSGMWLSGGVLTTAAGRLSLGEVSPLYLQAPPPLDALPPITDADLAGRWGASWQPNVDWRALMVSPRVPASASLGAAMWAAAGKPPIDGVLVVDPVALAGIVRATGPVQVGDRTITADQVVPELLHDQYRRFSTATPEQGDRREALGGIAAAAFQALDSGDWSPADLAGELADAVAGRHLLAWSADPVEQRGWEAAGLAGDLTADSLFVSLLNRGGNKLDWFTPLDARLTTSRAASNRATEVTVEITVENRAPAGEPRYVAGPPVGQRWAPGTYVGVLAVDVPGLATDVRIDGVEPVVAGKDGRAQVVASAIEVPRGERKVVIVRFRMPPGHRDLVVEPSGRQPGITWHYGTRTWKDSARRTAKW